MFSTVAWSFLMTRKTPDFITPGLVNQKFFEKALHKIIDSSSFPNVTDMLKIFLSPVKGLSVF